MAQIMVSNRRYTENGKWATVLGGQLLLSLKHHWRTKPEQQVAISFSHDELHLIDDLIELLPKLKESIVKVAEEFDEYVAKNHEKLYGGLEPIPERSVEEKPEPEADTQFPRLLVSQP